MAMNFYGEELEILKAKGNSILAIAAIGTSLGKLNVKIGRYNQAMNHHLQVLKAFENCAGNNKLDIIITNGDKTYVSSLFNEEEEYFTMWYKKNRDFTVICSDPYSGESDWQSIKNNSIEVYE